MSTVSQPGVGSMGLRALHERMGRVYHQPVRVHSFTNKRFTVNFRVPLEQLRRIVPEAIALDEIRDTGLGVLSMCACDFWVSWFGWLPIPPVRNNDMLCRVSTRIRKADQVYRAYYTLRSDSSSRFLGFFGKRFSHFRKQVSPFVRTDDGSHYALECQAADSLCRGKLQAVMASVTKEKPDTTIFADIEEAKQFVFDLDGSCGYDYGRDMLSFQKIDYPPWDMYFCHEYSYTFGLIDYLCETFGLQAELDCVLFMQNTKQTWEPRGCIATEGLLMIQQWLADLESTDTAVRSRALGALKQLGPQGREAVPHLVSLMNQEPMVEENRCGQPYSRNADEITSAAMAVLAIGATPEEEQHAVRNVLRTAWLCSSTAVPLWPGASFGYHQQTVNDCAGRIMPALANLLTDPDAICRSYAADALAGYGPQAAPIVPSLVAALQDSVFMVRIKAAVALIAVAPDRTSEAITALVPLLPHAEVTYTVCEILGRLWAAAVPFLLPMLRQHTGDAQAPYIQALRTIGAPGVPFLEEELAGTSKAGRLGAIRTLGLMGQYYGGSDSPARAAFAGLAAALQDPDAEVRGEAARALVQVDPDRAGPAVPTLIANLESTDASRRGETVSLLARMGRAAEAALPSLRDALTDPEVGLQAAHAMVAIDAGQAADAVPVLMAALQRSRPRAASAEASSSAGEGDILESLGRIGGEADAAVPLIRECMQSEDRAVRVRAAATLARVAPRLLTEALDVLMVTLADPEAICFGWDEAIETLGDLGPAALDTVGRFEAILCDEETRRLWNPGTLFGALVKIDPTAPDRMIAHIEAELSMPDRFDKAVRLLTDLAEQMPGRSAPLLARLLKDSRAGGLSGT